MVALYFNEDFFLIESESSGHKDLVKFLEFFVYSFNNPGLIFVDEFNSFFHTKLSQLLVKLFNEESKKSQFLFVTQDTLLMDSDYLRADQIYIVNRDKNLSSSFDRFSNYNTRSTQNYQKMYISSVVGKQPLFSSLYDEDKK